MSNTHAKKNIGIVQPPGSIAASNLDGLSSQVTTQGMDEKYHKNTTLASLTAHTGI
jgi:hypothetical protein